MGNKKSFVKNILRKFIKIVLILLYTTIIISMIAGGVTAGTLTLIPPDSFAWTVSKANYLGYMSICSFVPFSTLMLFVMALFGIILLFKLIKYLRTKTKNSEIYKDAKTVANKLS